MSADEVTAPADVEGEPSDQIDQNNGRVSVWVKEHAPLAIAIAGLMSALLTLLAANPMILAAVGIGESKEIYSLPKVTAEVAANPERIISQNGITEVSGSYHGKIQGRSLWGFVKNIHTKDLWPSHAPCSVDAAEGRWSCRVTPLTGASEFQIRLVDSRGVNDILQWVIKENAGNAPAMTGVRGSEVLDRSTISR